MPVHPDKTAYRAVDACGGTHSSSVYPDYASGFDDALAAACEAVKKPDALMGDLLDALQGCVVFMEAIQGSGYGGMASYDVPFIVARSVIAKATEFAQ